MLASIWIFQVIKSRKCLLNDVWNCKLIHQLSEKISRNITFWERKKYLLPWLFDRPLYSKSSIFIICQKPRWWMIRSFADQEKVRMVHLSPGIREDGMVFQNLQLEWPLVLQVVMMMIILTRMIKLMRMVKTMNCHCNNMQYEDTLHGPMEKYVQIGWNPFFKSFCIVVVYQG